MVMSGPTPPSPEDNDHSIAPSDALTPRGSHHTPVHIIGTATMVVLGIGAANLAVGYSIEQLVPNLSYILGLLALSLISTGICLSPLGRTQDFPRISHWLISVMGVGIIGSILLADVMQGRSVVLWYSAYYLPPLLLGCIVLAVHLKVWETPLAWIALCLPTAGSLLPTLLQMMSPAVSDAQDQAGFVTPDPEVIYETQPMLRAAAFQSIRAGDPSQVELYAILGAGHPYQRVFKREVEAVSHYLDSAFDGTNRSISLINDMHAPTGYPLMNRTNFTQAAHAIGEQMDDDDVLLIFLTSHGRPGALDTQYYGLIQNDLTPADINTALGVAGDPNAVIIVSACYSGSFVAPLEAPNRLILTAADADSVSFGCSDENEWTDWGRAFWLNAMAGTRDFRLAAAQAKAAVAEKEARDGYSASNPLISEGADIGLALDALLSETQAGNTR